MARWSEIADWIGPTVNEGDGDGRPGEPEDAISTVVGLVLHIQEGTEAGTEAWQRNPRSRVSSHFLLPKTGRPRQMVDTADRAWCQVAGNRHWLSLECEGRTGQALTDDQLGAAAALLARAHRELGVQLALASNPSALHAGDAGAGLGYHALGGAAWGGHWDCPGAPIINQRPAIVARAMGLQEGDQVRTILIRDPRNGAIYQADGMTRRWITSPEHLDQVLYANGPRQLDTLVNNTAVDVPDVDAWGVLIGPGPA
jgi:hypothetical protein